MYTPLINSIVDSNEIENSELVGEDVKFSGEDFIDTQELMYPNYGQLQGEVDQETVTGGNHGDFEIDQETISVPTKASATVNGPSTNQLGTLIVDISIKALADSDPLYKFTSGDALWLARFVEGEAGGKDNAENHAVVWAMFNRFGIFRHAVPAWKSFGSFLRLYSTTLQPLLNSVGAAKRVWQNNKENPSKYPVVCSEQRYKGTDIRRVQYKKHIDLQQKPWNQFSSEVQNLIVGILSGHIPNPGIGIATHFASTWVYLTATRRREKIYTDPSYEEWKEYTIQYAQQEHWIWIGERSNLNQKGNAFFIQEKLKDVPARAVTVVMSTPVVSREWNEETPENEFEPLQVFSGQHMGDEWVHDEVE